MANSPSDMPQQSSPEASGPTLPPNPAPRAASDALNDLELEDVELVEIKAFAS